MGADRQLTFAFDKALRPAEPDAHLLYEWAFDEVLTSSLAADAVEAPRGAGVAFTAPNNSVLFVKRGNKGDHAGEWCLPGGMVEEGEDDEAAARREALEETGFEPGEMEPAHQSSLNHEGGGTYTTFRHRVGEQFKPTINDESTSWHWALADKPPNPLHPQVMDVLAKLKLLLGQDAWSESDHPRGQPGNAGQFGSGGGGGGTKKGASKEPAAKPASGGGKQTLKMPQYGLTPKPSTPHQVTKPTGGEEFEKNWAKAGSVGGHEQPTPEKVAAYTAAYEKQGQAKPSGAAKNIGAPVHVAGLKKVGKQLGSNPGGVYEGPAGEKFYIKAGKSEAHVKNELLAGALYGLAGVRTLKYRPADDGKSIVTEWEKADKTNAKDFTPEERKAAQKDFAVHAWLANWDAAGLDYDNQMIIGGEPASVDLGGALYYRAQGEPKGDKFGTTAGEWDTLRNKQMNPQNAALFGDMSEADLKASAKKVTSVRDSDIRAAVKQSGIPAQMADVLIARKRDIAHRAGLQVAQDALALDRGSVRTYDADGRLHVAVCNISKANICPYVGKEIPGFEELGLEPDKIYKLYRDPEELAKAAPTFNNLQVLSEHVPVDVEDHRPELTVGSLGTDAVFEFPYLKNSLVIWEKEAIKGIESGEQCELSAAYRYRPDMTPGELDGEHYDGVMRDIVGNHEALVKEGRAGTDVVVGDSALNVEDEDMAKTTIRTTVKALMAHGAIVAYVKPKLAQDAKVDYKPVIAALAKVTTEKGSFKKQCPDIAKAIETAIKGKLATDASPGELAALLDMIDAHPDAIDADPLPVRDPDDHSMDDNAGLPGFLKGKLSEDDYKQACDMLKAGPQGAGAHAADADKDDDEDDDDKDKPPAKDESEEDDKVDKKAMDAAIKKATKLATDTALKAAKDIREAERAVRPYVGELAMTFDSASEVYKMALDHLKVDVEGVPPEAYPAMLKMVPKPGEKKPAPSRVAMDAAASADYDKMFPGASRIQVLG